ncbi:hypothetical protein [uncultured Jannaschia sp.]|uniref:hypothetical protein n=1 Tax=uncultured Jannaschia sp. TaxID=293347 RepID=UPI0026284FE8|nr:hypothetical protein [uncultured Jannaschia sp.]
MPNQASAWKQANLRQMAATQGQGLEKTGRMAEIDGMTKFRLHTRFLLAAGSLLNRR